jgi:large subunit ribosomal protein L36
MAFPTLFRNVRAVLPSVRLAAQPMQMRSMTSLMAQSTRARPMVAKPVMEKAGVLEQVRGMKVRSSVKKLCEGCKVCLYIFLHSSGDSSRIEEQLK